MMLQVLVVLGLIAAAWYMLIVRPQREQQGRHDVLVGQLSVGAHVMTVGGIYGRVTAIEGTSVVVEISPGLVTRVATDGISRIVPSTEAPLPQGAPMTHAHEQVVPQQPAPAPMAQHQHVQHQHVQQPYEIPPVTMRAQTTPWPDRPVAPAPPSAIPAPHIHSLGVPNMTVQHGTGTIPDQPQTWSPGAWQQPIAAPQATLHVSTHGPRIPAAPQFGAPLAPLAPVAAPAPMQLGQPQQQLAHLVQQHDPSAGHEAPQAPGSTRRRSKAPAGMGSSLRLDDPQLRDSVERARHERSELAEEYLRLTSPYVAEPVPQQVYHQAPAPTVVMPAGTVGQPLFVTPAAHQQIQPHDVFPAPARIPSLPSAMIPRPGIAASSDAFQRSAPYAPAAGA